MNILFLHGWQSTPGGLKPTYLRDHGHAVLNPYLPDDDFDAAVRIAQAEFDRHHPDVVVGSSRGGAVAMNIDSGDTPMVLLCPAWKTWGTATTVKPNTTILHSEGDETVPIADSRELLRNSGLPESALIVVGTEHRLADEESSKAMLRAVENSGQPKGGDVLIRPEAPDDCDSMRDILIAAFANHPYSHQTEHLIVEGLRADDSLTVSLVAEVDGNVVGRIAFSPVKIGGKDHGWLALGPVAVLSPFQRRGIGQAPVNEGLKTIRDLGAQGCVLVGDPAFYNRFGFRHNLALRMEGVPPEVLLCLPMWDEMPHGSVTHHPAFSIGE
jgi:predicted N-acetyltransferase YhbS